MNVDLLHAAARVSGDAAALEKAIRRIMRHGGDWRRYGKKFLRFLGSGGTAEFSIFVRGNSKLPFFAFSTLPQYTCPGAGDCLAWCYSFKAWRYPAAFYRQLQNTILVRRQDPQIDEAWRSLPRGVPVRLYVDGDIDSRQTLRFWFRLCEGRQDLRVYGYSKSWPIFLGHHATGGTFPSNYLVNVSGGSRYSDELRRRMLALPCSRGEFVAVASPVPASAPRAEYVRAVLAAAGRRAFVCPGKCGACAQGRHACGSEAFRGIPVAIGLH